MTIITNQTWCRADNPHLVTSSVTIAPGGSLTLEPGVEVRAASNAEILVRGSLAVGSLLGRKIAIIDRLAYGDYLSWLSSGYRMYTAAH